MDSELTTSFDIIAATAFHGNQKHLPSVSLPPSSAVSRAGTNSVGMTTTSTHSRKSSAASHARKDSWGLSAIKTAKSTANATGLCAFSVDGQFHSPEEEKSKGLEGALMRENTKYVRLDEKPSEKRDPGESGVMLIAPHAVPMHPTNPAAIRISPTSPSPVSL